MRTVCHDLRAGRGGTYTALLIAQVTGAAVLIAAAAAARVPLWAGPAPAAALAAAA